MPRGGACRRRACGTAPVSAPPRAARCPFRRPDPRKARRCAAGAPAARVDVRQFSRPRAVLRFLEGAAPRILGVAGGRAEALQDAPRSSEMSSPSHHHPHPTVSRRCCAPRHRRIHPILTLSSLFRPCYPPIFALYLCHIPPVTLCRAFLRAFSPISPPPPPPRPRLALWSVARADIASIWRCTRAAPATPRARRTAPSCFITTTTQQSWPAPSR
jgi:hypothetical protein